MAVTNDKEQLPTSRLVATIGAGLLTAVRGVAFWIAALLPLAYLPFLYLVPTNPAGFAKLLALNLVAVVVGHSYKSVDDDE